MAFLPADAKNGRLAGNYITHVVGAFLPCTYSFAACNFAVSSVTCCTVGFDCFWLIIIQGHTKKVTINAIILIGFCVGNILGPLSMIVLPIHTKCIIFFIVLTQLQSSAFRNQDAPQYLPAKITIVAVDSVAILLAITLLLYYKWENKRRDRSPQEYQHALEFADLTDKENKQLRYKY